MQKGDPPIWCQNGLSDPPVTVRFRRDYFWRGSPDDSATHCGPMIPQYTPHPTFGPSSFRAGGIKVTQLQPGLGTRPPLNRVGFNPPTHVGSGRVGSGRVEPVGGADGSGRVVTQKNAKSAAVAAAMRGADAEPRTDARPARAAAV